MRIGIDLFSFNATYSGGIATFALGITKGLARSVSSIDSVVVLVNEKNETYLRTALDGVNVHFLKVTAWPGRRYAMEVLKYASWAIRNFKLPYWFEKVFRPAASTTIESALDVLIVPTTTINFYALNVPTVLCLHDIQEEYFPQFFSVRLRAARWGSYRASCWKATAIQASSQFVKNCILEKFKFVDAAKIFVAYEGVDFDKFNLSAKAEQPPALESMVDRGFVFYPAQIWPHKNHLLLIEALAIFRRSKGHELTCVLTGQDYGYWKVVRNRIRELGLTQVRYLGRVDFEQLLWLYQNCEAVLALGLHESSSLPIREGAVFGKPLICSNIPPNVETRANLVLRLVDCHDPRDLAQELHNVMEKNDSVLDDSLRNIGRVRMFDWDLIAKEYLSVIDQWRLVS